MAQTLKELSAHTADALALMIEESICEKLGYQGDDEEASFDVPSLAMIVFYLEQLTEHIGWDKMVNNFSPMFSKLIKEQVVEETDDYGNVTRILL
jgi:hypothetical protein